MLKNKSHNDLTNKNRVYLLSRRWPHHAGHSGYDLFGRYVGEPLTADPVSSVLVPDRVVRHMQRTMRGYDRVSMGLELRAAKHMATHRNCIYHILYGDNGYYFLGRLNGWRGHHVMASFHHPPGKFAHMVRDTEKLSRLSAVVVVGTNQIPSFTDLILKERIFTVPHPVDTSYFAPPADFDSREENLCLFVGSHLRDFGTLRTVIEDAWVRAPQLKFVVVAHPFHVAKFNGVVGNLTVLSRISEEELREFYQKATLFLQPLQETTANNAVLEAIACGLPTVVTDVGAIRDYVHEDSTQFVPPFDSDAMLDVILDLVNDRERRRRMAAAARKCALMFEWRVVAQQMNSVYDQVLMQNRSKAPVPSAL
jgi:glycosyltransferase involved in cell wall biosynthesis